ncbi:undecaprenyldiphospho-muramoylpentapeptide beta-N-acetylglucosaminyltransferase [Candidatus Endolissoclinum faulkneri L5]|uniref:UDP-N-acetylglucosamine--N-acetylmuramyl-(pentapeptide) pyrophosphoryl-undecaprenol N-acetylglucosamine transferase n=1 Tax=Candidatus Endolissoclinum faulkneri L5 TaxID=1401328 RepID=V9TTE2_9PROT|nr:undecaprenyldiphospho-muramoylpentapeptide beta-N-acetylglucosaminyltransferase [Candidatus Endolissoclinum faulkneri]AHC73861.1 undecaprenyldiphospho-muramoylpentapeptide beta-N-acetylglucosaminyltransferase [Candidatus Endolissoclinum faulkneri L5]
MIDKRTIVLAAGGTGGHFYPTQALAELLVASGYRVVLITDTRGYSFKESLPDIEVYIIKACGIAKLSIIKKIKGATKLLFGYFDACRLISELHPTAVLSFGGYACVPTVLAASRRGIPIILHEQNAIAGRSNQLLAKKASIIATSFERIEKIHEQDQYKIILVGNPVRAEIRAIRTMDPPPLTPDGPCEILVTGGSQGASIFAKLIPDAIALMPKRISSRIRIVQQARLNEINQVIAAYRKIGINADVSQFFNDMPQRLRAANLLICRSGASTLAENTVAGRPALLVPYPNSVDDHQTANARAVEAAGGGMLLPQANLTPKYLAQLLTDLLNNTKQLSYMSSAARAYGRPNAAKDLASILLSVIGLDKNLST